MQYYHDLSSASEISRDAHRTRGTCQLLLERCWVQSVVLIKMDFLAYIRAAATSGSSSPPDSWGRTGQEHTQQSGSHPSSPPGLPTLFPDHIFFKLSRKWLPKSRFSSEQRQCCGKAEKMSVYQLFPFLSLLQIAPPADSNT